MTTIGLGLIAVLRSDIESAKEHYALLGLEPTNRIDFECGLAMDRMLGLLSQTQGQSGPGSSPLRGRPGILPQGWLPA